MIGKTFLGNYNMPGLVLSGIRSMRERERRNVIQNAPDYYQNSSGSHSQYNYVHNS